MREVTLTLTVTREEFEQNTGLTSDDAWENFAADVESAAVKLDEHNGGVDWDFYAEDLAELED